MARSVTEFLKANGYVIKEHNECQIPYVLASKRIGDTEINIKMQHGLYSFWLDNAYLHLDGLCDVTMTGDCESFPVILLIACDKIHMLCHSDLTYYAGETFAGRAEIDRLIEKAMGEWK